jgi:hypothetical protein
MIDKKAKNVWTDRGGSTRSISNFLKRKGVILSHMTVQRYLKQQSWGYPYKRRQKPLLSRRNIIDREKFCTTMINRGYTPTLQGLIKAGKILFTDEKIFALNHKANSQNHRMRSENPDYIPTKQTPVFDQYLYTAAGFWSGGKTKIIFYPSGRLNNKMYIKYVLPEYIKTCLSHNLLLQQDHLKVHYSNMTKKFLSQKKVKLLVNDWPGSSPDLVSHI